MTLQKLLLVSTLISAMALPAVAGEEVISFQSHGAKVVGTLTTPGGGPAPVVILFHGFTGSRDELAVANTKDGVFSRTAHALAAAGYASVRIDFRGSGQSDALVYQR